jgi:alkylation response protein AidB-like acyl-CoA dehydrogenase
MWAGQTAMRSVGDLVAELRASESALDGLATVPDEVACAFRELRLPALCLPRRLGGAGQPVRALAETAETLARADGGVAWALFILGTSPWLISRADAGLAGRVYDRPDRLACGVLAPSGRAVRRDGRWLLTGTWSLASAHGISDWAALMARTETGPLLFLVPTERLTVTRAWDGLGLGTSGSATVSVADLSIEDSDTIDVSGPARWPEPQYRLPFKATFAIAGAILLGLAREALDQLIALAQVKRPVFGRTSLAAAPATMAAVSRLHGVLAAARILLYDQLDEVVESFMAGEGTADQQARLRIAIIHACDSALTVVDTVHRLAGSEGARHGTRISRVFRDAHTASQHYMFGAEMREVTGAVLLGGEIDLNRL